MHGWVSSFQLSKSFNPFALHSSLINDSAPVSANSTQIFKILKSIWVDFWIERKRGRENE